VCVCVCGCVEEWWGGVGVVVVVVGGGGICNNGKRTIEFDDEVTPAKPAPFCWRPGYYLHDHHSFHWPWPWPWPCCLLATVLAPDLDGCVVVDHLHAYVWPRHRLRQPQLADHLRLVTVRRA
jgi:hypothetical protein